MSHMFLPGDETWISSQAPVGPFGAVFEDDGTMGFLYAVEREGGGPVLLDALHIYNVRSVTDREIESELEIRWTADGQHAALLINDYAHAVFDFTARRGFCRTGLPAPPDTGWSVEGHAWSEDALRPFGAGGA